MNNEPPTDVMTLILKRFDVPELLAMRPTSRSFNDLISQNRAFIEAYNLRENTLPWIFSYSVVPLEEQEQGGVIYGLRAVDERRITVRIGDPEWVLLDMCDSILLFLDPNLSDLFVVNPFDMTTNSVLVPDDFPQDPFVGDFHIQLTTDERWYKVVYVKVVDQVPQYFEYDSGPMWWTRLDLNHVNCLEVEVEQTRNILIRSDDEINVLYMFFYMEGDNDIPCYKRLLRVDDPGEYMMMDEDVEMKTLWSYCGVWGVRFDFFESEISEDIIFAEGLDLYKRNANGTQYEFLADLPLNMLMPQLIDFASLSMKEVNGIVYVGVQTHAINHGNLNANANRFIYRFDLQNLNWLDMLMFPPINGNRHAKAVFTSRLTLPEPLVHFG